MICFECRSVVVVFLLEEEGVEGGGLDLVGSDANVAVKKSMHKAVFQLCVGNIVNYKCDHNDTCGSYCNLFFKYL